MGSLLRGLVWPIETVFPYIAMQAVISVAGVFLLIRAYQWGEASQVSVLEYSIMIFGPFFAWLLMGQSITTDYDGGDCPDHGRRRDHRGAFQRVSH